MANRINPGGNGSSGRGMVDLCPVGEGGTLLIPNPVHPPPGELLHAALTDALQKFLLAHPIRVRATLPIVHDGTTVAIFVWWDRVADLAEQGPGRVGLPARSGCTERSEFSRNALLGETEASSTETRCR